MIKLTETTCLHTHPHIIDSDVSKRPIKLCNLNVHVMPSKYRRRGCNSQ